MTTKITLDPQLVSGNEFAIIPFCPRYEISREGIVRRIETRHIRKPYIPKSYHAIALPHGGGTKQYFVHRLVALVFIPNPEKKPYVNHKDGNKLNNHVDNLEWCTSSENNAHAFKLGLKDIRGEKHPSAKLTNSMVQEIHVLLNTGMSYAAIGRKFNVSDSTISGIDKGKNWKHI